MNRLGLLGESLDAIAFTEVWVEVCKWAWDAGD